MSDYQSTDADGAGAEVVELGLDGVKPKFQISGGNLATFARIR